MHRSARNAANRCANELRSAAKTPATSSGAAPAGPTATERGASGSGRSWGRAGEAARQAALFGAGLSGFRDFGFSRECRVFRARRMPRGGCREIPNAAECRRTETKRNPEIGGSAASRNAKR